MFFRHIWITLIVWHKIKDSVKQLSDKENEGTPKVIVCMCCMYLKRVYGNKHFFFPANKNGQIHARKTCSSSKFRWNGCWLLQSDRTVVLLAILLQEALRLFKMKCYRIQSFITEILEDVWILFLRTYLLIPLYKNWTRRTGHIFTLWIICAKMKPKYYKQQVLIVNW